jgi:hypothetical protein
VSRAKTTKQSTEDYNLQKKSIKYKLLKEKRESQLKKLHQMPCYLIDQSQPREP